MICQWRNGTRSFANLGRTPFYITFTGGEPFLRRDLDEMVISVHRHCRPSVITIPTNGLLTDRVVERGGASAGNARTARLVST